jgi:uncharacterized protein YceH (UPF0502 family)
MSNSENSEKRVRIQLTADQQEMIKKDAGKDIEALEFSVAELEERIAPSLVAYLNISGTKQG